MLLSRQSHPVNFLWPGFCPLLFEPLLSAALSRAAASFCSCCFTFPLIAFRFCLYVTLMVLSNFLVRLSRLFRSLTMSISWKNSRLFAVDGNAGFQVGRTVFLQSMSVLIENIKLGYGGFPRRYCAHKMDGSDQKLLDGGY